jgi:hypothetical protein
LGRTIAELEATLDIDEYYEWQAYYTVEPFGTPAEDDRWRQHYALFYSANAAVGAEQPEWLDRTPEETARLRAKVSAAVSVEDKIEAFFGGRSAVETEEQNPEDFEYVVENSVIVAKRRASEGE